jgi:4-amino-4-deoxy-L-arabinose transferase-like glycosyltransferase
VLAVHQTTLISEIAPEPSSRDFLLERFPAWTLAHWCVITGAICFIALTLLPDGRLTDFEVPSGGETVRVARSLATTGAFADPFVSMRTGATAHVAPVYPFLYSLVLRMFGTGYLALRIFWACNVGFFALQMGLLPLLSWRLHMSPLIGIVAAVLGTLSLHTPIDTRWESFLAGLLLLWSFLAIEYSFSHSARVATLGAGLLCGILILTNPVLVLLLPVWPLCWILAQPKGQRLPRVRRCCLIAAVAVIVVLPWIARNYARFGGFVFVRDCLGLELYTSNYPCASATLRETIESGCHARTNPNATSGVAAQLAAVGEVRYNRAKLREALIWMNNNRSSFLRLTFQRFRLFWFPDSERRWEAVSVWLITLLSFGGLWAMAKRNPLAARLIGVAWLLFPLIYYVSTYEPRYRYPIYWTSLLPAALALVEIAGRVPFFRRVLASHRV